MKRIQLIAQAKQVIIDRDEDAWELSSDFLEGFSEGVAEFLAVLLKEPVADLLEEITTVDKGN